jgi:hypothetical protein
METLALVLLSPQRVVRIEVVHSSIELCESGVFRCSSLIVEPCTE